MSYHRFKDEDGEEYGSFEVFYADVSLCDEWNKHLGAYANDYLPGWYWWACFPGCVPDDNPMGPFDTGEQAYDNAMEVE